LIDIDCHAIAAASAIDYFFSEMMPEIFRLLPLYAFFISLIRHAISLATLMPLLSRAFAASRCHYQIR